MAAPTRKADEIALVLEQAILAGEISPGAVLRQEQLSEEFRVSRTPIREALGQLAALGLVTMGPGRGVKVHTLSRDELRGASMIRAALEGFAAELARDRITKAHVKKLERAERKFAELTRSLRKAAGTELQLRALASEWVHANEELHDVFLDAAGVPQLAEAARKARRVFHGQAVWSSSPEVDELYEHDLQQHRAIVAAFADHDPEVRFLVERHVLDSVRILELALEEAGFGRRHLFSQRVSWLVGTAAAEETAP